MVIQDYKELKVYQLAFQSAMQIFTLSHNWPAHEKFALTDQIRRSSRSVCGNIAEAWRKRRYPAHFVSKLSDADAETAETEVWLNFALECGYLSQNDYVALKDQYHHMGGMLTRMMNNPEQWCKQMK